MKDLEYQKKIIERCLKDAVKTTTLAEFLGTHPQHIYNWKVGKAKIPLKYAVKLTAKYDYIDITKLSDILTKKVINRLYYHTNK